jgi:NAD(P)-dependent dehydrogenase (short-subunit alcohol dehydrogenase family)
MDERAPEQRRRALVTGASRGIGRAAALSLARDGWDLVLSARTVHEGTGAVLPSSRARAAELGAVTLPGSLEATAADATALGAACTLVPMDLLDRASVEAAGATASAQPLDAVVLSGVYQGPGNMETVEGLDLDDAHTILIGNYLHQVALIKAVLPALLAGSGGTLVNLTSFAARHDPPAMVGKGGWGMAYAAGKAAMHRVVGHLHVEFGDRGLRGYNVDPGNVLNAMAKATSTGLTLTGSPPEPIGDVIAWLCAGGADAVALAGQTVVAPVLLKAWRSQ